MRDQETLLVLFSQPHSGSNDDMTFRLLPSRAPAMCSCRPVFKRQFHNLSVGVLYSYDVLWRCRVFLNHVAFPSEKFFEVLTCSESLPSPPSLHRPCIRSRFMNTGSEGAADPRNSASRRFVFRLHSPRNSTGSAPQTPIPLVPPPPSSSTRTRASRPGPTLHVQYSPRASPGRHESPREASCSHAFDLEPWDSFTPFSAVKVCPPAVLSCHAPRTAHTLLPSPLRSHLVISLLPASISSPPPC
jgi:hypothetical protein